jgi:hypothetical protein
VPPPPINGTPPACSRPQPQLPNPASQVQNSNAQFCSLEIHLEEVLLELERVRRIKSGSAVKIKREIKKIREKVLPKA